MAGLFLLPAGTLKAINAMSLSSMEAFGRTWDMAFPLTLDEYLHAVARETARLSWPGRMSALLEAGAKKDTEAYFTCETSVGALKNVWSQAVSAYDLWHEERVVELAKWIAKRVRTGYRAEAVAAKLVDTFMHQLVKYEECRYLWADLHLVLDCRVFASLRALARGSVALRAVSSVLDQNPYRISTAQSKAVQRQLREFVGELNLRPGHEFDLDSRIQLNLLWADAHPSGGRAGCR